MGPLFMASISSSCPPAAVLGRARADGVRPDGSADLHTTSQANEDLRARYRYLDLRRTVLSENIQKRSKVAHTARTVLEQEGTFSTPLSAYDRSQHVPLGFTEVETPVLLRSSPEGAREYLVPSRIARAEDERPVFYALQQSPQQPKQLLICSGAVDRYFQLAKCFRDEGGRKDRQPEFTQIDMEMAFVSWGPDKASLARGWRIGGGEVRDTIERLVPAMWAAAEGIELPSAFPVMTYQEAMNRVSPAVIACLQLLTRHPLVQFGSDKPDTRVGLEVST